MFRKGNIPWNKNLTKETDKKVSLVGLKLKGKKPWNVGLTAVDDNRIASGKRNGVYGKSTWNSGLAAKDDSRILAGESNPFYGKTHSDEQKEKWSQERKGKPYEEFMDKETALQKRQKHSERMKQDNPTKQLKTQQKLKELHPDFSMEKNPNWKNGISFEPYGIEFNELLKSRIRKRDEYICQFPTCDLIQNNRKHSIHHIDYNKQNNSEYNLITLCDKHHNRTNGNRSYWIQYFQQKINEIYGKEIYKFDSMIENRV